MRQSINISFVLMLFFSFELQAQSPCEALTGVWKYELDDQEGMNIITPTHVIWVLIRKGREDFKAAEPTDEEKAAAFTALNASAGTWTCEGNRATITYLFNKNPAFAGTSFDFEYEIEGNLTKYWIIQSDGSRGPMGKSWKVADWEEVSDCSGLTGVWEHLDLKGMYIQAGPYAAFIVVDEDQKTKAADLESTTGKARAYEAVSAAFAVSTCAPGGKVDHILFSSDPSGEGAVLQSEYVWEEGHIRAWILNPDGSRMGEGMRVAPVTTSDDKYVIPRQSFQRRHSTMLYQITGSFTGALNLAKERGISAEDYGRQLGELYKHSWNKEAGAQGYIRGMLYNSVCFSKDPDAIEILDQSDTSIEYKWKANWEGFFEDGKLFGTTLEDYYAFFNGVMQPISSYLGATYEQKRLEDGWLWVAISKK